MRNEDGYWFRIKHLKLLKNYVDIPILPNHNRLVGAITTDLNTKEVCQLPHILHAELFRKCLLDGIDGIDTGAEYENAIHPDSDDDAGGEIDVDTRIRKRLDEAKTKEAIVE